MIPITDVLALDDVEQLRITVKEWKNAEIIVSSMTALERADVEKRWAKKDATSDPAGFRSDILTACLKTEDGKPWATPEQIKQLMGKNAKAMERLFEAACKI